MRFQETSARWTEINSYAVLDYLLDIYKNQDRNVVKAAMSQACQPLPSTFFPPK